ncbi:hypothetical protein OAB00_01195 [Akkermansiaceae bacterium]|nr:hypothetical protein [Akkermansiaceae bacterium]
MKKYIILAPVFAALSFSTAFAKDKDKKAKPTAAELIAEHDSDEDGKLDETELTALLDAMPKKGKK